MAFNGLAALLWLGAIYAFFRSPPWAPGSLILLALFAAATALFAGLRIRVGRFDVSSAALVGYISIAVIGPRAAALAKLASGLGMAWDNGRGMSGPRTSLRWFAYQAPTAMLMTLLAGITYVALGGPVGSAPHGAPAWLLPYVLMQLVYTVVNVAVLSVQAACKEWRHPADFVRDLVARVGPSVGAFAAVGVVLQSMYYQFGPISLVFMVGLLLLARLVVRVCAENQDVVSEMSSALARMLTMRDPYTGGHSRRVADLAVSIGRVLRLTDGQLERLRNSALVHDIGKVAVPDAVLRKPGPLDPAEWAAMDVHVEAGGEVLEHSPRLRHLARYVRAHHVDYGAGETNGPGAVRRLPVEARILAVADAFDAMTSDRPYRNALPVAEAVRRLRAGAGSQFDPACVDALVRGLGLEGVLEDHAPVHP